MNLIAGFLAGAAASMGLGGGFVLILYLTLLAGVPQQNAQAANLVFFLPIALISMLLNAKAGLIEWKAVPYAAGAGVAGAAVGALLGLFAGERTLSVLFGAMLVLVGIRELFFGRRRDKRTNNKPMHG